MHNYDNTLKGALSIQWGDLIPSVILSKDTGKIKAFVNKEELEEY